MITFRVRVEYWAECDVVHWTCAALVNLSQVVCGKTNDGLRAQQSSGGVDRHVRLSKMHAIRIECHCDIDAIVNDDKHVVSSRDLQGLFGITKKILRRAILFSQLNEGCAPIDQ